MAEGDAPALPADIMADIRTEATESFTYWQATATEAQRAKGMEEMQKFMTDEAFIAQEMASMQADFDAQSPVDGRLDEAKYVQWIKAIQGPITELKSSMETPSEPAVILLRIA